MAAEVVNKVLTETDVQHRLSWPTPHLGQILPPGAREAYFEVVDNCGHLWLFKCKIRNGKYAKPVITGRWRDFARAKGVMRGYKVVIWQHQDGHFSIQVQKPFRLFGKVIEWTEV
ncbi:hypothetical protein Ancab_040527 [Ancistrocladus abbreviatus]